MEVALKDCRRVTVKDIAEKMNVSLSTVNKALTGKSGVSEKRRAEIVSMAKEMGYEVNHIAQALSRGVIKIGVIIPSLWRQYYEVIEAGMRMEFAKLAQQKVEGVFRHVSHAAEIEGAFCSLCDEGVDVIAYCPSLFEVPESLKNIAKQRKVPVFIVGDASDELPSVCSVFTNSKISAYMAADMLAMTAKKGGVAAVFVGSLRLPSHKEKADCFRQRALELGFSDVVVYETLDNLTAIERSVIDLTYNYSNVTGIYAATAVITPIVDRLERLAPTKRPAIVATDIYDEVRKAVSKGYVLATVFQNQKVVGRLAVRKAYDYVVNKMSYNSQDDAFTGNIYVMPQLFLPSRIDEFKFDYGNEYILEHS